MSTTASGHDPNPNRGKVSILQWLHAAVLLAFLIPSTTIICVLRRLLFKTPLSFGTDLQRSFGRNVRWMPRAVVRWVLNQRRLPAILESPRVKSRKRPLCQEVLKEDFAGWWVSITETPPNECDVVILFIHGGAYHLGHPLMTLPQLLRVMEILETNGKSAAVFALNYPLAPEAQFPRQYESALAAYEYLTQSEKINPTRIAVHGESAGGHLVIALLHELYKARTVRPGASFLLSPWLNLTNSGTSFQEHKYLDTLTKSGLDRAVDILISASQRTTHPYLNFALPAKAGLSWKDILPAKNFVTLGSDEALVDDVEKFVAYAHQDGVDITLDVSPGMAHAWQSIVDVRDMSAYLALPPDADVAQLMKGAANIAKGYLELLRVNF
ncbi:alpha/beta-hydrolase [Myriangium duriaei CBS 260.36]|uniref:Alpha/beta-hydrolase n=1 Tax=Myriangium duriaei CBS 260.36 TaxID=1168546 RepID=A0A9P4ISU6_9PEZI|nr:alpha/beta-hydrolase [Myriangium duriaei CBS 260.36]